MLATKISTLKQFLGLFQDYFTISRTRWKNLCQFAIHNCHN